jgi:hypothetical protein
MTLTITDQVITSDVTGHTAERMNWQVDAAWRLSWLPDRLLTRNEAITGMTIAEHAGEVSSPLLRVLADELGLVPQEAVRLAAAPPADTKVIDAKHGESTADDEYRSDYNAVWGATVRALTAAVRLRHPRSGELDVAGFLASALGAVAGNVGRTDRIVAGRPGSWESDLVQRLVGGTVGYDQNETVLARYRTEPVVVPLNVHQLMLDDVAARTRGIDTPYEQEIYALFERLEGLSGDEYEVALTSANAEEAAAKTWWTASYAAYAEAFAGAVAEEAARIEGLQVPVALVANTALDGARPDGLYDDRAENPDEYDPDVDLLVLRLWKAARDTVPLPTRGSAKSPASETSSASEPSDAAVSRVTVAGFTVTIDRSSFGPEVES